MHRAILNKNPERLSSLAISTRTNISSGELKDAKSFRARLGDAKKGFKNESQYLVKKRALRKKVTNIVGNHMALKYVAPNLAANKGFISKDPEPAIPEREQGPGGMMIGAPDLDESKKPLYRLGTLQQSGISSTTPPDFPCYYWDPVECRHKSNFMWGIGGRKLPKLPIGTRVNGLVMGEYGLYNEARKKQQEALDAMPYKDPFWKQDKDLPILLFYVVGGCICIAGSLYNFGIMAYYQTLTKIRNKRPGIDE